MIDFETFACIGLVCMDLKTKETTEVQQPVLTDHPQKNDNSPLQNLL